MSTEKPAGMASGDPTKQITTLFQTVHQGKGDVFPFKQPYTQDLTAIPEERADSPCKQTNTPAQALFPAMFAPDPVFDEFVQSWPEDGTLWVDMQVWYKKWFDATGIFKNDVGVAEFTSRLCMSSTLLRMNTSYSVLLNWLKKRNLHEEDLHKYFHDEIIESFAQYVWYARVEGMQRESLAGERVLDSDYIGMDSAREIFQYRMLQLVQDIAANERAWISKLYDERVASLEAAHTRESHSPTLGAEDEPRYIDRDFFRRCNVQDVPLCARLPQNGVGVGGYDRVGEQSSAAERVEFPSRQLSMARSSEGSQSGWKKLTAKSATGKSGGVGNCHGVDHGIKMALRQPLPYYATLLSRDGVYDDWAEASKGPGMTASYPLERSPRSSSDSGSTFTPKDLPAFNLELCMRPAASPKGNGKGKQKET
ncbi:unnamed protein product [Diplocarpon coronariae]|uniref:Uncharacterized protein n=1 Tax=Diplocarpon coronariae TaxID=2795749 RepID=A0A218ZE08_9HELO|nr:hypothetical protein B2J93_4349 [Marssonina coronariae]